MTDRYKALKLRNKVAVNIRKAAKRAKLGTNQLADAASVSRSQLYDILASNKGATVDFIQKLARPLKVQPDRLLR